MSLPVFPSAADIPPELLTGYTIAQLSQALAAVIMADTQNFNRVFKETVGDVEKMRGESKTFAPLPRLLEDLDGAVKDVLESGTELVSEARRHIAARNDVHAKAARVRAIYERYASETLGILNAIESSPRG